jgi:WD40 repeat protein
MSEDPSNHPTAEELRALSLGQLPETELARVSAHLGDCPACCRCIDQLTTEDPLLARLQQNAARLEDTLVTRGQRRSAVRALHDGQEARAAARHRGAETAPVIHPAPGQVGDYDILAEVGRGGMGVVYKARHRALHRLAALKMVLAGEFASPTQELRFRLEAELAARVQHANIVQVYEIGSYEGRPFLALEWVEGGSLANRLDGQPWPPSEAARLIEMLARAIHVAHGEGVVHRDLKPANILLQELATDEHRSTQMKKEEKAESYSANCVHPCSSVANCIPKITDFGLAQPAEGGQTLTQSGFLVGTPGYMAPEQASGKRALVGPATDIYALGVVLYQLLTGHLPFQGDSALEVLRAVMFDEPARPRRLRPRLPRDLEAITLHCLEKEPGRRYPSALALAEDLQRFQEGKQVAARPVGAAGRLARWARRYPGLAAALAAVALLLVTITAASIGLAVYFGEQEQFQRNLVLDKTALAARNQKLADDNAAARKAAEEARQRADTTLVDMQTSRGLLAAERGNAPLALLWFATAAERAGADPQRRADNRLRARNWMREAVLPVRARLLERHPDQLAFRPSGDFLLLRAAGRLFLWDCPEDRLLAWADGTHSVSSACWCPNEESLAVGTPSGQVQIRRVPDGKVLQELHHPGAVVALAFSPDGRYLALASEEVQIWDLHEARRLGPAWKHPATISALAFNHTGNRLMTACRDGTVRVFAVGGGPQQPGPLFDPVPHASDWAPVFIDGDRGLVTVTGHTQLTCWDAERGKPRRDGVISTKAGQLRVAASPRGDWFAAGGWSSAQVWKADDPGGGSLLLEHPGRVDDFAFSSDGRTLLTASWDQAARIWSLPEGRLIGPPLPHMGIVYRCDLSRENGYLATAQGDGLVRVWKRPVGDLAKPQLTPFGTMRVRVGPDGLLAAPGLWHEEPHTYNSSRPAQLVIQEVATGRPAGPAIPLPGALADSCICADNRSVAAAYVAGPKGWLSVSDVATGRPLHAARALPGRPVSVDARPHSSEVAVLCKSGTLLVVDAHTGEERYAVHLEPWCGTENIWERIEYTPDGATLVALTDGDNNALQVREANTGRLRYPPIQPVLKGGPCRSFALSSDSRLLATAVTGTNAAQVWDLSSGRALSRPLLHPGDGYGLFHVSFSPDGRFLLTSHKDGEARLWDWKAGALACPPLKHPDEVFAGWVLPDGRHAVTACRGTSGTLHVWELTTGKPVATPLRLARTTDENHVVAYVSLSPDGKWAHAIVPILRSLTRLSLPELLSEPDLPTEDLVLLGELASGRRIALGDESCLNSDEWLERWQRFRRRQPGLGRPPLDQRASNPDLPKVHPGPP